MLHSWQKNLFVVLSCLRESSLPARLRIKDTTQTTREMLMYKKPEPVSFPRRVKSGNFRYLLVPSESLLVTLLSPLSCCIPWRGQYSWQSAVVNCTLGQVLLFSAERHKRMRWGWKGGMEEDSLCWSCVGMSMQQHYWNMKWVTVLAPSCIQHRKWSQIWMHFGLILAKIVPKLWCGSSHYFVVWSSWKGD